MEKLNSDSDIFEWIAALSAVESKLICQKIEKLIQGAEILHRLIRESISKDFSNPVLYFILGKLQFLVITF